MKLSSRAVSGAGGDDLHCFTVMSCICCFRSPRKNNHVMLCCMASVCNGNNYIILYISNVWWRVVDRRGRSKQNKLSWTSWDSNMRSSWTIQTLRFKFSWMKAALPLYIRICTYVYNSCINDHYNQFNNKNALKFVVVINRRSVLFYFILFIM